MREYISTHRSNHNLFFCKCFEFRKYIILVRTKPCFFLSFSFTQVLGESHSSRTQSEMLPSVVSAVLTCAIVVSSASLPLLSLTSTTIQKQPISLPFFKSEYTRRSDGSLTLVKRSEGERRRVMNRLVRRAGSGAQVDLPMGELGGGVDV